MTVDYNKIVDDIIEVEGGYVDHPNDKGGPTKYGITQAVAREWDYYGDMQDLSEDFARTVYLSTYIYKPNFNLVAEVDPQIGEYLIDYGVNCGPYKASKELQRSLNLYNKQELWYGDLYCDGKIGPKTIASLKEFIDKRGLAGRRVLAETLKCLRGYNYINIAEKDSSQEDFIFGWMANRI